MEHRKLESIELNRIDTETFRNAEKVPVCIILDNVRSQNNVGSVFRTCDAFRIEKIWLCGICPTPENREVHKTALGAEEAVDWEYVKECSDVVRDLKEKGYRIVSVEQTQNSFPLEEFTPEKGVKYAFILGNEVKGVQQEIVDLSDMTLEIPQFGTKHSLNVSVTAGIVMWQAVRSLLGTIR